MLKIFQCLPTASRIPCVIRTPCGLCVLDLCLSALSIFYHSPHLLAMDRALHCIFFFIDTGVRKLQSECHRELCIGYFINKILLEYLHIIICLLSVAMYCY